MPPLIGRRRRSLRRVLIPLAAALVVAACSVGPTPPPTAVPTIGPTSALSPAPTSAPASPAETAPATRVPTSPSLKDLSIATEAFARISDAPLSITAPDDGTDRLFVGNQDGQVWVIDRDGSVDRAPAVDLDARIASGGERGLLGIALHPAFPTDPRLFVDFTNNDGDTVIASLELDRSNPGRFDPASYEQLLVIDQPFSNHNGGALGFGPNGYLTIAMGDGGGGGDPFGNGQNPAALLGKILRIDVDGGSGGRHYGIPPENPFANGGGAPEVWIGGLRNPWRTSFDRATGDFWLGDVGQGAWEEIDVVRAGTVGPVNFGWNVTEGPDCYAGASCDRAGLMPPVSAYDHALGCAVVGGHVYRGARYPFLVGTYLFSDSCSSRIWAIDASSNGPSEPVQVGQLEGNVSSFGEDADGELYVLTLQGQVLQLLASLR